MMARMWVTVCGGIAFAALLAAADISGNWLFVMETPGGERRAPVTIKLDGDSVTGTWETQALKGTFKDDRLELAFPFTSPEADLQTTLTVSGTLKDDALVGTWTFGEYGGSFTASRQR